LFSPQEKEQVQSSEAKPRGFSVLLRRKKNRFKASR